MPTTLAPELPPPRPDITRCTTCDAQIIWTVTEAQRRLPVDAEPNPAGNTAIYQDHVGRWRSRGLNRDRPDVEAYETRHMPHFATCTTPPLRRVRRT